MPSNAPPTLDPTLGQLPQGYGKSARETKTKSFHESLNKIIGAGTEYANYLTGEETRRYNESNKTLSDAAAAFDTPSMTDEDIARMFSGKAEEGSREFLRNMGDLRGHLGRSGSLGGNFGASMAVNFEAKRLASLTDATRSLYEKRIETDMADRGARWMAQQAVAAGQARDPSVIGLDWIGQAGNALATAHGMTMGNSNARHAADAARQAGYMNLAGSLFSSAITAIA